MHKLQGHATFGQLDKPRAVESAKSYKAYKTVQESCSISILDAYHFQLALHMLYHF